MDPDGLQSPYSEDHALAVERYFDASFYLAANADVRQHGLDPLTHFLTHGWREGRDPSREFSVAYYQRANPDVAALGLNPLLSDGCQLRSNRR